MSSPVLRIGSVPYLNADPLTYGLESRADVALTHAVPSLLLDRLLRGELDCAFAPTFDVLHHPDLRVVDGHCVCSHGPVASVVLLSRPGLRPEEFRTVGLDTSSKSSAGLVRVLLAEAMNSRPEFVRVAPDAGEGLRQHDAVLLIGDRALQAVEENHDARVWDLGQVWHEHTGLPFVYAVFVLAPDAPADRIARCLQESKEEGLRARPVLARRSALELGLSEPMLNDYLVENIQYDLGPEELSGAAEYRRLLHKHGILPEDVADGTFLLVGDELSGATK